MLLCHLSTTSALVRHPQYRIDSVRKMFGVPFGVVIVLLHLCMKIASGLGQLTCGNDPNFLVCLQSNYSKYDLPVKDGLNQIDVVIHLDEITKVDEKNYRQALFLSAFFCCFFQYYDKT